MTYGSTMFGKLWEWIMGIIAWIMSKFTRVSVGGDSAKVEPETQTAEGEAADASDDVPEPNQNPTE